MFPMMDPEKMKPMEEDEAVKKMANIGAIMEGAGASFGEEDMRLFRDAFAGTSSHRRADGSHHLPLQQPWRG